MQAQDNNTANDSYQADGIVSVNSRGGSSGNMAGKIVFIFICIALLLIAALVGINKWRANSREEAAAAEKISKAENKPAMVGQRRLFDSDPPPLPPGAQQAGMMNVSTQPNVQAASSGAGCSDGLPGTVLLDPNGKPMVGPGGAPMRVCKDGRIIGQAAAQPIGVANNATNGQPAPSRYAGNVLVSSANGLSGGGYQNTSAGMASSPAFGAAPGAAGGMSAMDAAQMIMGQMKSANGAPGSGGMMPAGLLGGGVTANSGGAAGPSPAGSVGSMLTPSSTPMVSASKLGDRNMILPKGRTIDCSLSTRVVSEVAGMATCVLTSNVYSDNGRVVLLERGSEAVGEYKADMAQGQRRLFLLWTRVKTPSGVVINLNSPAADALGTSGLDGYVDNHWWERLGAAFLLSFVQDAIAFAVAKEASGDGNPQGSVALYQNMTQTGNTMAEKVLASTINIKPTLYKNQGDRATIFVARDLDFGSVYALRAR